MTDSTTTFGRSGTSVRLESASSVLAAARLVRIDAAFTELVAASVVDATWTAELADEVKAAEALAVGPASEVVSLEARLTDPTAADVAALTDT